MATMTAAPAPAPYVSASLYVGDLAPDVIESKLFDIFNSVGPVASIRVCRDSMLKRSLGYAYVNFHTQPDALRALNTLNYTDIQGRPCRIMWSQRDPSLRKSGLGNVFVKNIHPEILHKELQEAFSVFGNILSCKVAVDAADGKSKGYGYVQFESEEAAKSAIEKLNGQELKGQAVEVKAFQKKSSAARATEWTNLYVKNIPTHFNEADFITMFKEFGEIKSAKLMVYSEEDAAKDAGSRGVKVGGSKGFGFIDFAEHEAAVKAVEALNGKMFEHPEAAERIEAAVARARAENREIDPKYKPGEPVMKPLFTARAQPKAERVRELKHKYLVHRAESESNMGKNLYIKNLDENVDDEQLHQAFQGFGTITSARIMRYPDPTNTSRGFGFVCFSTAEEASRANHEMMGKSINGSGKPMFVALAQPREQRQQLLSQQMMNRSQMGGFPRGPMGGNMYNSGMPMMYPGMPRQGFPPMMGGFPRGAPRGPSMYPARPMQYVQMPGQPMGAGMMPPQQFQGQRRQQNRGPAGPRQGGPAGPAGMPQMQPRGPMTGRPQQTQGAPRGQTQQPGIKFTQNVRNQPGQVPTPAQAQSMAPAVETAGGSLTLAALAAADEAQQKNMIGERLYPLIQHRQPEYCGKITGMLLEMDNSELLHLLESDEALDAKINEAMDVLRQHFSSNGMQG